jgi:hypothetical protein
MIGKRYATTLRKLPTQSPIKPQAMKSAAGQSSKISTPAYLDDLAHVEDWQVHRYDETADEDAQNGHD